MLTRDHIISLSLKSDNINFKQEIYDKLETLSNERAIALLDNMIESLDHEKSVDLDQIFHRFLSHPDMNDEIKVRLVDLALKATNFVQKWFLALVKRRFHEKYRFKLSQNLYFRTNLRPNTVIGLINFAKNQLASEDKEVVIKAHCFLESFGFKGKRENDTQFFIAYVLCGHKSEDILIKWSEKIKKTLAPADLPDAQAPEGERPSYLDKCIQLKKLFIPNILISEFFIHEIKHVASYDVVEKILVNLQSHKVIDGLFSKVFRKEVRQATRTEDLLVTTFRIDELAYTKKIVEKLFHVDPVSAERILKVLVIRTKCSALSTLFYERCCVVDSAFIEACVIYKHNIHLAHARIDDMIKSHHLGFLLKEYDIFERFILVVEESMASAKQIVSSLFENQRVVDEKMLRKLLFLCKNLESARQPVSDILVGVLANYRINTATQSLAICDENGPRFLFCGEAASYLFQSVNTLRKFPAIENFCEILVFVQGDGLLDCLFSNNTLDTFFTRAVNEIHKHRAVFAETYEQTVHRLASMDALFENTYWSTIVRQQIKFDLDCCADTEQNPALNSSAYNLMPTESLVRCFLDTKDPSACRAIEGILDGREKYATGLALNDSVIDVKVDAKKYCIYCIFYQYDSTASCNLLTFVSPQGKITLGIANNRYFVQSNTKSRTSFSLLKGTGEISHKKSVAVKVEGCKGTFHYCSNKSTFKIDKTSRIIVGEGFKGVILRMLFYENVDYSDRFLSDGERCGYFLKHIKDLQKKLVYADSAGLYIDTLAPYHFTSRAIEVQFYNVVYHQNLNWRGSEFVQKKIESAATSTS